MSMSDCEKCWNTPCTCGYDYRNYTKKGRIELASKVLGVDVHELESAVQSLVKDVHPMRIKNEI
jgi:hypothetical protein